MRDDLHPAAVRLLASLPVTEHRQREPDGRKQVGKPRSRYHGGERKAVRIKGVEYASMKEARRKLKLGAKRIQTMLDIGTAEYV